MARAGRGPDFDELLTLDLGDGRAVGRRPAPAAGSGPARATSATNFRTTSPMASRRSPAPRSAVDGDGRGGVGESFPASDPPSFAPATPTRRAAPPAPTGRRRGGGDRPPRYRPSRSRSTARRSTIQTGSVAIAAITSCTNTSNPTVMVGAGLLARNAVARGLRVAPTVKTSLAPGSKAVTGYLEAAGLMAPLEKLGLRAGRLRLHDLHRQLRAARCADRRGDRGERPRRRGRPVGQPQLRGPHPSARPRELSRLAAARRRVRAGGPGRHRPHDRAARHRLGRPPVFLADIWPSPDEIRAVIGESIDPELFRRTYAVVFEGDDRWRALPIPTGDRYAWDPARPTSPSRRSSTGLSFEAAPVARHRRRARPGRPRRLGHDRPHLARPARSRPGRPPASGSRSTASARSSSTRTARGAATTR